MEFVSFDVEKTDSILLQKSLDVLNQKLHEWKNNKTKVSENKLNSILSQIDYLTNLSQIYDDKKLRKNFLEYASSSRVFSKKALRRFDNENFDQNNYPNQNETFFLIDSYLTLTQNKNKSKKVDGFSNNAEKFYYSIISQRWEQIAKNHTKPKTSKKDLDSNPKTFLDLILSNVLKDYPPNSIDRLVFEEFLIKFRTLSPQEFLIYCKSIEKISKLAEKLAEEENTIKQYHELFKPSV